MFDFPGNRDEFQSKEVVNYIKRLVGEPGDTILVKEKILINLITHFKIFNYLLSYFQL